MKSQVSNPERANLVIGVLKDQGLDGVEALSNLNEGDVANFLKYGQKVGSVTIQMGHVADMRKVIRAAQPSPIPVLPAQPVASAPGGVSIALPAEALLPGADLSSIIKRVKDAAAVAGAENASEEQSAKVHDKMSEIGLGSLDHVHRPPAGEIKSMQRKIDAGRREGQSIFPKEIPKSFHPPWKGDGPEDKFGSFPSFLYAHEQWGIALCLVEKAEKESFCEIGDYMNYKRVLMGLCAKAKSVADRINGPSLAIEYDALQRENWAKRCEQRDPSFDLRKEMRMENDQIRKEAVRFLSSERSSKQASLDAPKPRPASGHKSGVAQPSLYKTAACRFWEKGSCSKGAECTYIHEGEAGSHRHRSPRRGRDRERDGRKERRAERSRSRSRKTDRGNRPKGPRLRTPPR